MPDSSLILTRAKAAAMSRDYPLAIRLYTELLKQSPDDMKLLTQLGALYVKAGQDKKALPLYRQISMLEPDNFNALLNLGGIYRRLQKYQSSIDALEKALATGKNDLQANYSLGFTYKFMGNYDDAIDCFESVIAENPADALAFNHLGVIYTIRREYDKAVNAYSRGLKADPNHPILHLNLAHTYEDMHKYSNAALSYAAALRAKPGWMEAIADFSDLLLRLKRAKDAEGLVDQALRLEPGNTGMHTLRGRAYVQESNYQRASEEFAQVIESEPKNRQALSGLAFSYEKLGQLPKALEVMKMYEAADPSDAAMVKQYAEVLLSAGKPDAAVKKIKKALSADADDVEALNLAAQYYTLKRNAKRALVCIRKIESADPTYHEFYKDVGNRYRQIGNLREARHHLEKYLHACPDDAAGILALAAVEEAEGNTDAAIIQYHKALKYDQYNEAARLALKRIDEQLQAEGVVAEQPPELETVPSEDDFAVPDGEEIEMEATDESFKDKKDEPAQKETEPEELFDPESWGENELIEDEDEGSIDFADDEALDDEVPSDVDDLEDLVQDDEPVDADENEIPGNDDDLPFIEDSSVAQPQQHDLPAEEIPVQIPAEESPDENSSPSEEDSLSDKESSSADEVLPSDDDLLPEEITPSDETTTEPAAEPVPEEEKEDIEPAEEQKPAADLLEQARKEAALAAAEASEAVAKAARQAQQDLDQSARNAVRRAADEAEERIREKADNAVKDAVRKAAPQDTSYNHPSEKPAPLSASEQDFRDALDKVVSASEKAARTAQDIREQLKEDVSAMQTENSRKADETVQRVAEAADEAVRDAIENLNLQASKMLPSIANILSDRDSAKKYLPALELFKKLKSLSEYLPPEEKAVFQTSRTRLLLDYLIARLSGKPGLLATAQALRNSGTLSDFIVEEAVPYDTNGIELAEKVMKSMKTMTADLPDESLATVLDATVSTVIDQVSDYADTVERTTD
jgi:tetratricopeptide (TPR) repeat protein